MGMRKFAQQRENVAARSPAEDAVFELQADHIDVVDVQEVGGAEIRIDVLFDELEAHAGRIVVALFRIVDGQRDARRAAVFVRDGFA